MKYHGICFCSASASPHLRDTDRNLRKLPSVRFDCCIIAVWQRIKPLAENYVGKITATSPRTRKRNLRMEQKDHLKFPQARTMFHGAIFTLQQSYLKRAKTLFVRVRNGVGFSINKMDYDDQLYSKIKE